jgi:hypothetical protein
VRVESSASSLSTALVRPVDPTSPDTTHRADPSTKSYDGITDTPPLPRKSEERGFFGRRSDPLTYSIDDDVVVAAATMERRTPDGSSSPPPRPISPPPTAIRTRR